VSERADTASQHTVDGVYTANRASLHASLIAECLDDLPSQDRPVAVLFAGGPASGKSTLVDRLQLPPNAARIDVDAFRQRLPEFAELVAEGSPEAGPLTHREASQIAKAATVAAIHLRLNLVIDAVGGNERGQFSGKIQALLRAGYRVVVCYATLPVETAEQRERQRFADTGRGVPASVLREKHAATSRGFQDVERLPVEIAVYETSQKEPRLVASGRGGQSRSQLQVHDPDLYDEFLERGKS
jgi:predicted ABC-type ATPase